jgi:hypothetical protein
VHVTVIAAAGFGVGFFCAVRALRAGTLPKEVARWSGLTLVLGGAYVLWQLVGMDIMGDHRPFLLPSLSTKAERSFLMYYGFLAGALGALAATGFAFIIPAKAKPN